MRHLPPLRPNHHIEPPIGYQARPQAAADRLYLAAVLAIAAVILLTMAALLLDRPRPAGCAMIGHVMPVGCWERWP